MLWLYLCFSEEAHIRVSTLTNHLLQHNAFTKLVNEEIYLPHWQRLGPVKRTARFIVYLLTMFAVTARFVTSGLVGVEQKTVSRVQCSRACQEAHYPMLSCGVNDGHAVTAGGNVYDRLYSFYRPRLPYPDQPCVDSTESNLFFDVPCYELFNQGRCPEEKVEKLCPLSCGVCAELAINAAEKVDVISPMEELYEDLENVLSPPNETYVGLSSMVGLIQDAAFQTLPYLGLMHEPQIARDFSFCRERAILPWPLDEVDAETGRTERLHTCFSLCHPNPDDREDGDTRRPCDKDERPYHNLLCVAPDEPAPDTLYRWGAVTCIGDACISWTQIFAIIVVFGTLQTLIELAMYSAADISEADGFSLSTQKCLLQSVLVLYFVFMFVLALGPMSLSGRLGQTPNVVFALIMVFVFDQIKNPIFQFVIWKLVIRRCGEVYPGIQEYNQEYLNMWDLKDSLMQVLRTGTADIVEHRIWTMGTVILVSSYSGFILGVLLFAEQIDQVDGFYEVAVTIDLVLLFVFVVEICMKTFAYSLEFWFDKWNFIDNCIVIVSLVIGLMKLRARGLGLLRLLKLLRVLILYRKVSEGRKKLKKNREKATVSVGTNVDKVIDLIDELVLCKTVTPGHKDELDWISSQIISNKLYVAVVSAQEEGGNKDVNAWLTEGIQLDMSEVKPKSKQADDPASARQSRMRGMSSAGGVSKVGGFSRIRTSRAGGSQSKSRRQSRRGDDNEDQETQDSLVAQLYMLANVTSGEEAQFESMLNGFDEWTHDLTPAMDTMEANLLPIIFCKLTMFHDFINQLSLDFELLFNACQHIQLQFHPHVQFHGPSHTTMTLHAANYFIKAGLGPSLGKDAMVQPQDLFALLFCSLSLHYSHPGLTNDFLVKVRHPRALRYNDIAVLENYNLSRITTLLSDPECNFLIQTEPAKIAEFRQLMIKIVLKMDISQHFNNLGFLNTKLSSDSYPNQDVMEDRVVLLSTTLRCADLAWACHAHTSFQRWADKFIEELLSQGDVEKQVGVSVSPFSDRDLVNTAKAQLSFLLVIVAPIYNSFAVTLPSIQKEVIDEGLEVNRQHLQTKVMQAR